MSATPNFHGQRALVLHRPGATTERLGRQLTLLGFQVDIRWKPVTSAENCDLLLVDADEGWSGLLPWTPAEKPMPIVALLGSEAPGRITWALDQGADALIAKPVAASAVFPALVMAARRFAEACEAAERMAELRERIRLRPLVLAAMQQIMTAQGLGEDEAYRVLRRAAMQQRLTVEQWAAALLAGQQTRAG